jgi:putative addiction module component (TIGR02574 family)
MVKEAIPHFAELTVSEKLLLLEELWDDLAGQPSEVPVWDWQKRELERRYQEYLQKCNTNRVDFFLELGRQSIPVADLSPEEMQKELRSV